MGYIAEYCSNCDKKTMRGIGECKECKPHTKEVDNSAELSKLKRLIGELEIPREQHTELEACINSLPSGSPNTSSQSASQIADSIEAACFPGQGQYIDPKASWVLNWYQQLRALKAVGQNRQPKLGENYV